MLRAPGPFSHHNVQLEVLHRGIEYLLDHPRQPMNLIDKQHVALVEIADDGRQIAGSFDGRSRGDSKIDPEFARDDVRQRGFAQARWRGK